MSTITHAEQSVSNTLVFPIRHVTALYTETLDSKYLSTLLEDLFKQQNHP